MKKLLTVLFAVLMVVSLAACGKDEQTVDEPLVDPAPTAKNTYADFVNAELGDELELLVSVQAHESWWDNKVTIYAQDDDGGYLIYECACDENTANALTEGTLIRVTGSKDEWPADGEVELTGGTLEIIAGGYDGKVYEPQDLTSLIGNNDELKKKMNVKGLFKNLTVVGYDWGNGTKDDSDLYLHLTAENGTAIDFTVRRYLTAPGSDIYNAVEALQAGDVVDLVAFVYWYESPECRIIGVTKH